MGRIALDQRVVITVSTGGLPRATHITVRAELGLIFIRVVPFGINLPIDMSVGTDCPENDLTLRKHGIVIDALEMSLRRLLMVMMVMMR